MFVAVFVVVFFVVVVVVVLPGTTWRARPLRAEQAKCSGASWSRGTISRPVWMTSVVCPATG